mmetsp:Transcript_24331/g.78150  ORF Transcript_24331/g.78150 Transcript_24331/m.78150 type:complete len:184 (+) Transcript_24331:883-1434(+)
MQRLQSGGTDWPSMPLAMGQQQEEPSPLQPARRPPPHMSAAVFHKCFASQLVPPHATNHTLGPESASDFVWIQGVVVTAAPHYLCIDDGTGLAVVFPVAHEGEIGEKFDRQAAVLGAYVMVCGAKFNCLDENLPIYMPAEVQDVARSIGVALCAEPPLVSRIHDPNAESLWCLEVVLCQKLPA